LWIPPPITVLVACSVVAGPRRAFLDGPDWSVTADVRRAARLVDAGLATFAASGPAGRA
jgi:hypothetical protein